MKLPLKLIRTAKKSAMISLWAVFFSCLLYWIGGGILSYLGVDTTNLTYIKHYYDYVNNDPTNALGQDSITILDTQDFSEQSAREDIARLIGTICKLNPKAVGVDIRFPSAKNPVSDAILIDTIKKYSDIIVLAQAAHGEGLLPSIFDGRSVDFGLTNLPDYSDYISTKNVDGNTLPLFSYLLYRKSKPAEETDLNYLMINYSSISFEPIDALEFLEEEEDEQKKYVENKYIILGDVDNPKDYHNTPFKILGQDWTQGVFLHAYALYSIVDPSYAMKSLPFFWNIVICYCLCFIFTIIFVLITDKINSFSNSKYKKKQLYYKLGIFIKPILILMSDFFILFLCYLLLTVPFNYVPDVVLYLISVLLINTFNDFVSHNLKNTNEKVG